MEIQGQDFGIEIEMTGLTRSRAAEVLAEYFGITKEYEGTYYDAYYARDSEGRKWKVISDASLGCQRKGQSQNQCRPCLQRGAGKPHLPVQRHRNSAGMVRKLRDAMSLPIRPVAFIFTSMPPHLKHPSSAIWSISWQQKRT